MPLGERIDDDVKNCENILLLNWGISVIKNFLDRCVVYKKRKSRRTQLRRQIVNTLSLDERIDDEEWRKCITVKVRDLPFIKTSWTELPFIKKILIHSNMSNKCCYDTLFSSLNSMLIHSNTSNKRCYDTLFSSS